MVHEQKAPIAVPLPSVLVMHVPTASVPLARAVPILSVLATLAPRVSAPLAVSVLILNALVMHARMAIVLLVRAVPILSVLVTLAPRVSVPLAVSVLILNAPVTRGQRESVPATPDPRVSVLLVRPTRAATVLAHRIDPRVRTLLRSSMTHSVQSR
jgi:hypothetical protein